MQPINLSNFYLAYSLVNVETYIQYEESLREMGLPDLQDRRERSLITLYYKINGIEKMDKQDLVVVTEELKDKRTL